jgi:hypothetical protein
LILYLAYHYFLHLLSTNHKCTQPCYFPLVYKPAAQKLKEILNSLMKSSRRAITPDQLPMELWCRSAAVSSRVLALVFCKTLFGNKYIILCQRLFYIHFLYGICVNLIPGHTYYEHSVWPYNRVWQWRTPTTAPWGQRVSSRWSRTCPSHGLWTVDNSRPERPRHSQVRWMHRIALLETLGSAGPWNTICHPRQGRSGGNHSAPSEMQTKKMSLTPYP